MERSNLAILRPVTARIEWLAGERIGQVEDGFSTLKRSLDVQFVIWLRLDSIGRHLDERHHILDQVTGIMESPLKISSVHHLSAVKH